MLSFICGFVAGIVFTVIVLALLVKNPPNFLPW